MQKLNSKQIIIGVLGIIAIIVGFLKNSDTNPSEEIKDNTEQFDNQSISDNNSEIVDFNTNEKIDETDKQKPGQVTDDSNVGNQRLTYNGKELILTYHAKCRMNCREISKSEVREVIREGKENKRKSNPNDARCPTIALEDWTEDGQRVRIIVADCDNVAKLVTVIDLENEYQCDCK